MQDAQTTTTTQFVVGTTYSCRSICDHDCIYTFTVIRRTAKTVTFRKKTGEIVTCRPSIFRGAETAKPNGSYSMCAVIDASDTRVLS